MTSWRKTAPMLGPGRGLTAVRYTPAASEDDAPGSGAEEDGSCSELGRLTLVTSAGGGAVAVSGDVAHHARTLSCSSALTLSPPPSATTLNTAASYPFYDFQETEEDDNDDSDCGGCDSTAEPSSPNHYPRVPNGNPLLHNHSHYNHNHNNNNNSLHLHPHLSGKVSSDSTDTHRPNHHHHARPHKELRDSRLLRELSKSTLSRGGRAGPKGRCLCCMMCIFLLSTAGLGAVLALAYSGHVHLAPDAGGATLASSSSSSRSNGRGGSRPLDRVGEDKVTVQYCETQGCTETAAAILSRMNTTADPCNDFYNYACGGYDEKTYLSWFSTRVRENPEEIIQHYRRYAIDRLSSSYAKVDSPYVRKARTLFRSCLFRSDSVDDRTRDIVAEVIEGLGGLTMADSGKFDLTPLVANVTRMYGASPFFKIRVRGPKKVSIVTRLSDYQNPLRSSTRVLSRNVDSRSDEMAGRQEGTVEDLLLSLLARVNYTGDLKLLVRDYLRLEANIRRTFNQNAKPDGEDDLSCDEFSRSSFSELQFRHGTYGINWTELVLTVLDTPSARDVTICDAQLSRPLQHLLEMTPHQQLWQFAILHTLLHSDLFLLVSGRRTSGPGEPRPPAFNGPSKEQERLEEEDLREQSPENRCLDLLDYVMPSLKSSLHCDEDALKSTAKEVDALLEHLRGSLFHVLQDLFHVTESSSWRITNTTVNRVKVDVLFFLKSLEVRHDDSLTAQLDEYDFAGNMLELVRYRNQVYFQGKVHLGDFPDDVTAFGVRACFEDSSLARPGPQLYHASVPHAVRFGSLGTYLASKIAAKLGIADLLDHYSVGVLNHSAVLGLAVRLQCFVDMYSSIKLLDYGTQSYKLNGEEHRVQLWKDQLALQMITRAWRTFHNAMSTDKSLPGLPLTRDQLFYVAHAQTQCEKVSERGILQHYIQKKFQLPNQHRVNGPLRNLHDFYRAFGCGPSKDICELF